MDSKVAMSMVALLLAAAAQAASDNATTDIYLWFNCRAVIPYVNSTSANFTLLQYNLLAQLSVKIIVSRNRVSLMLNNMEEIKKLNISDPRTVFEEIKRICLAGVKELGNHLNKTVDAVYGQLNASKSIEEVANNAERGLQTLMRVRNLLTSVNASNKIWIE